MDYLLIKICFISACIGWVYVDKLTAPRGLFDWVPKYYKKYSFHEKVLRCPHCTGGWISCFTTIYNLYFIFLDDEISIITFLGYTTLAPIITIAMVNIIKSK